MYPAKKLSMSDLPGHERPRERLLAQGARALSTAELLAIILRTGTQAENVLDLAGRLLAHYNGLPGLAAAAVADLQHMPGIGAAKATQIAAALEIGRRLMTYTSDERPVIGTAADAARLVMDMQHLTQEHVRVILLDGKRRVVAIATVYVGTLNASLLRAAEVYREAVTRNCPAIILVHNHPAGEALPSPEDVELTRRLAAAGQLLDVKLADHLIVARNDWVSLRALGLM